MLSGSEDQDVDTKCWPEVPDLRVGCTTLVEDSDGVLKIGAARHSEAQVIEANAVLVEAVATDCPVRIV